MKYLYKTLACLLCFGCHIIAMADDDPYVTHWQKGDGCDGTVARPYVISTPAGLNLLANEVNDGKTFSDTYFELGSDISYAIADSNYTAIHGNGFCGHLDGKNCTISGIRISKADTTDADS